jgi:Ser/Thr protein kinase RdoA (MazF antagonist)
MANIDMIQRSFDLDPLIFKAQLFGSGLIHSTYMISCGDEPRYILQRVNHQVFRKPEDIAHNLRIIGSFLKANQPDYTFTSPIPDKEGKDYVMDDGDYYRLYAFVAGTHTVDLCEKPEQAFEAAFQFGKFTAVLADLRTDMLRYTIPGFHDLINRYNQFLEALQKGDASRIFQTKATARFLLDRNSIVDRYQHIQNDPYFKKRVTHHDTKISNVLFNENNQSVCVIDLDTVMPGYFISDLGDMIRTYVSPASEEESDLSKVTIRKDFVKAIFQGYNDQMGGKLSEKERSSFVYSGKFMIYMQALRFYTDHLNNDVYYGAKYENHNLVRALNQVKLLTELELVENDLNRLI